MTRLILSGGTGAAAVGLFDADALPCDGPPSPEGFQEMESRHSIVRFSTGRDGRYLLHAYVDEAVPAELLKYCSADDKRSGRLNLSSGKLAFGGVEAAYATFVPNSTVRSDARVAAATYDVTAYRTEYPDNLREHAIRARVGAVGSQILNAPGYIVPGALVLPIVAFYKSGWLAGALLFTAAAISLFSLTRSPTFKRLSAEKRAIDLQYPSIVVHMKSASKQATVKAEVA
jgi:hypothetical protein